MISNDVDLGVCSKYKEIGERCTGRLWVGYLSISFEVLDFLTFWILFALDGPEEKGGVLYSHFPEYSF